MIVTRHQECKHKYLKDSEDGNFCSPNTVLDLRLIETNWPGPLTYRIV